MPKVSALMPVYNTNLGYLKEAIESVLNQTFKDFEFLILNDSPTNLELENFILEYAKKDDRIKYFKNPRNLGISPSRNKLIDLAQGEFLAVIDHDDISVKERFEKEVKFLEENQEVGVVSGYIENISDQTIHTFPNLDSEIKIALMEFCAINHPASMIRKFVLDTHKIAYNALYSPCEDYKLWCDLIEKTEFGNLNEVMIKYRNYDNTTQKDAKRMKTRHLAIVKANRKTYPNLYDIIDCISDKEKLFVFGIPFFTLIRTNKYIKIKLFDKIQLFKIQKDL